MTNKVKEVAIVFRGENVLVQDNNTGQLLIFSSDLMAYAYLLDNELEGFEVKPFKSLNRIGDKL